jgi:hypothetical protein
MKKNGVTKRTRDRNVRRFAKEGASAWKSLYDFVDVHCKRKSAKEREAFMDGLCDVVDKYVELNCAVLTWCHKNGVDPFDFISDVFGCDVDNVSF